MLPSCRGFFFVFNYPSRSIADGQNIPPLRGGTVKIIEKTSSGAPFLLSIGRLCAIIPTEINTNEEVL